MDNKCLVTKCLKEQYARGYCKSHYSMMMQSGVLKKLPPKEKLKCKNHDCNQIQSAKGFCEKHYREYKVLQNPMVYKLIEEKRKERAKEYKRILFNERGGKCEICGYNKNIHAIDFHHKDPNEKEFEPAKILRKKTIEEIKIETDKCLMICKNCHAEIHHPDGSLYKMLKTIE